MNGYWVTIDECGVLVDMGSSAATGLTRMCRASWTFVLPWWAWEYSA